MSLQNITITGSIKSIATQSYDQRTYISSTEEQSFPIETITGSQAGTWPNFAPDTNYTVDLIVNISQSWSGSNISPSGIIPYVHNTMDEFYNGEFSGSAYTVTNGSLIDAQCEQFLTVNTTPTSYSIFPYNYTPTVGVPFSAYLTSSQFSVFINYLTAPPNGGILLFKTNNSIAQVFPNPNLYKTKITHLKISRFDKEGNDNTLSLQELTNIKWTDSTLGIIDLKILNISEYPTYYLYEVSSKTWSSTTLPSLADDNILNYSLSASFIGPSASAGLMYLDDWNWDPAKISGGTFNGVWTFDVTPNITTRYTASITADNYTASPVTFDFNFIENTYVGSTTYFNTIAQTQSLSIPAGQQRTFTLKGTIANSFIGNSNVQYHLETKNLTAPISLSNTFWIITQSVAPQLSTSSVVLEPYLLSNFANSDCDVLMNNASQNDISTNYREVLYDNGGNIPSNLQQILDNTAEFAQVNDYIFSARSSTLPRFEGSRTTSPDINLPYVGGFTNKELSILDTSSLNLTASNLPNIDITTPYFAYFEKVSSPLPRSQYGSKLTVTRLVDAGGTSLPLDGSNTNLISLETIFKQYSSASIFFIATANSSSDANNNIETVITDSGVDYQSIFYFQSKQGSNNVGTYSNNKGQVVLDILQVNSDPGEITPFSYANYSLSQFTSYWNMLSLVSGSPNFISFKYTLSTNPLGWPWGPSGNTYLPALTPYEGSGYMLGLLLTFQSPYQTKNYQTPNNYDNYSWIKFANPGVNTTATYDISSSLLPIKAGDYIRVWNVTQGIGSNNNYGDSYTDSQLLLNQQLNEVIAGIPNISNAYSETKKILSINTTSSGLFYRRYGSIPGNYNIEAYPALVDNPIVTIDKSSSIYTSNGARNFIFTSQSYSSSLINDVTYSTYYSKFIAVGDNGLIITSSDGYNWSQFIPPLINSALPNFNEKLTAVSANDDGCIYIVGNNSLILTNNTTIGLNNLRTSSGWNSEHPYPDSRYSFTCVYNPPDTPHGTTGIDDVIIGGYDNLLDSGSLVGYNQINQFTSASFSKLTNINSVYLAPDIQNAASQYGIGAAVGDNGLIIQISNNDGNGVCYINKGVNQVSKSLNGPGYPGFSGDLYSVDVFPIDPAYGFATVYAVGENGSTVYYYGGGDPFNSPGGFNIGQITNGNLRKIKRFEDYYDTIPYLDRFADGVIDAERSSYIVVGDDGFIAESDDLTLVSWDWSNWSSSSIGNNLIGIAAGNVTSSKSEVKLEVDSSWETNLFPYGTYNDGVSPSAYIYSTPLQGFRIFRGEPSDQGLYIADLIPDGVGFVIPGNYNPEYNYLEVARKAGLITG